MKKIYTAPVLDVVEFNVSNIIVTSGGNGSSDGSIGDPIEEDDPEPVEAPRRNIIWTD